MASKEPVRVLVTGAAGQIGYAFVPMIHWVGMLGADQPVIWQLLEIPSSAEALNGVEMELGDAAFPLLKDVVATTDVVEACTGVNIAVMHVGFSRQEGMEAEDFMSICKSLPLALGKHAAADCKVLAVGDPANTSELFSESSIPAKNITCLARLDHYLAYSEGPNGLAGRVENAIICGNHPSTLNPVMSFSTVKTPNGEKSVHELDADDAWIGEEFIIIDSECSSAMSAASSAWDHVGDWETLVSMGEDSDGSHSLPAGGNGTWSIVEDLGTPTPAIFQSEVEGKIKRMEERLEMISNLLEELENREGAALHHSSSRIDELDRHADHAFENLCNKIEFLQIEIANLQSN